MALSVAFAHSVVWRQPQAPLAAFNQRERLDGKREDETGLTEVPAPFFPGR
jgi:hypothetical protein